MPWLSWRLSGLALSQQCGRQLRLFFSVGNTIPLIIHENGRKSRVAQVHAANNQFFPSGLLQHRSPGLFG